MGKSKAPSAEGSAFEKLVKAVVSVPKEEVERLRKADRQRKRQGRCQAKPA